MNKLAELHEKADKAGHAAAALIPDTLPCGYGMVIIKSRTKFANWARDNNKAYKNTGAGYTMRGGPRTQSLARNAAYAAAYADVLNASGVQATVKTFID